MDNETLTALFTFALVSSITPGPNNIMLMSSGTNFGYKRSIPHMLGVSLGFAVMVLLVGAGLMKIFILFPLAKKALTLVSAIYLIYLSYKIATSTPISQDSLTEGKPLTFIEASLFQWVNPKAWTMALASITLYAPSNTIRNVITVALAYAIVNIPSVSTWVLMGKQIRRALSSPIRLRVFNYTMATLLISSLYLIFF